MSEPKEKKKKKKEREAEAAAAAAAAAAQEKEEKAIQKKHKLSEEEESEDGGEGDDHQQHEGEEHDHHQEEDFDPEVQIEEERSRLSALITVFNEQELLRFEASRRSSLKLRDVQTTMEVVLGKNAKGIAEEAVKLNNDNYTKVLDEKVVVVMAGLTKLYLQELIEKARIICGENQGGNNILPCHLREAYRRMKKEERVPTNLPSS